MGKTDKNIIPINTDNAAFWELSEKTIDTAAAMTGAERAFERNWSI